MVTQLHTTKVMALLLFSSFLTREVFADTYIGCYGSIPSSYTSKGEYQYQTPSYCLGNCTGYTFFALTQGSTCYCGNDQPSGDTSSDCTTPCFGFGSDYCGGSDSYNIYALADNYVLGSDASSAEATSSSEATSVKSSSATTSSKASAESAETGTTPTTTSESKTTGQSTTSAISTESSGGTTVVIYSTVAVNPTTTATATSTISASSSAASSSSEKNKSTSKGAIVGAAVGGVVGGLALIAVGILAFVWFRRRSEKNQRDAELADSAYLGAMKRDNSQLNRPLSNPFLSKEDMIDQRLNPVMLGRRRISEGSLADEADYSRKILRVANPDDDD